MKLKPFILILCSLWTTLSYAANHTSHQAGVTHTYLAKPTGPYDIGFQDFHWINPNKCPDFNFNGKNQDDFSPMNSKYCHEVVARIYYPTFSQALPNALYYQPTIREQQQLLKQTPNITKKQIDQLDHIQSYSKENLEVLNGKNFPVLFFVPGLGSPAENYENFITELVSHGYIVVGINTPFINLVALPNGHVVNIAKFESTAQMEDKFVPLQLDDLIFAIDKIYKQHHSNALFFSMDLNHIGLLGHSVGARIIADFVHQRPTWIQAGAALDIGYDDTGRSLKKMSVPFLHVIAANRKSASSWPRTTFELGKNGYLVGITPSEQDIHYSYHNNFSDLSTLQYLPAFQTFESYQKKRINEGFQLKLMSQEPTTQERHFFNKTTYILIKNEGIWNVLIYENKNKLKGIEINMMEDLNTAPNNLPNKSPEHLSELDIASIHKVISSYHYLFKEFMGDGNGSEITTAINVYLVQFFDTYLKGKDKSSFKHCATLTKNTTIQCGQT